MKGEAGRLFREAAELYSSSLGVDHLQTKEAFERADAARTMVTLGRMSMS